MSIDPQLGGKNPPVIKLYETVRVLTFAAGGYVNAVVGDIGKGVVGGTSGDTGILLEYDNGTRVWKVRPTNNGDIFDVAEVITITAGTGTGTTTGASTTETRLKEYYEMSGRDIGKITPAFPPDLDGPPILLGSRKKKIYQAGNWFNCRIIFLFDNDNPGMSKDYDGNDDNTCQAFLLNLYNARTWRDTIKVQPHNDKSEEYTVWLPKSWQDVKEAFERSYGYRGVMEFEGLESLSEIDLKE